MRNTSNIPAMAGMTSKNGQLTIAEPVKTKKGRTTDPYAICNIGKRIWNPLIEDHVDFQEFYRLIRDENVDLSTLKINDKINCGREDGKYQFDGTLSEAAWLLEMDLVRDSETGELLTAKSDVPDELLVTAVSQTPTPTFEGDSLARVCVSQATEIDTLRRKLDKREELISNKENRLVSVRNRARDILRSINDEMGENELPF